MTQDEVDLIYDYLHEHYEYVQGDLINKFNRPGNHTGKKLGSFKYSQANEKVYLSSQLQINRKKIYVRNSKLNYIYHHKKYPKYLKFLDANVLNINIENLQECEKKDFNTKEHYRKNKRGFYIRKNPDGSLSYMVQIEINNKSFSIGGYDQPDIASDAFHYGRHLLINENKTPEQTRLMVKAKYPPIDRKVNKTGYRGVQKVGNKYSAFQACKYLGLFDTPEEAHEAYLKAKKELTNEATSTLPNPGSPGLLASP